jgi:hypothetical protein
VEPVAPLTGVVEAVFSVDGAPSAGLFPPRKSVTYHPLPLSAKFGAVTCFEYVSAPHAGHLVSASSDIFCMTSSAWPHVAHL